VAHGVRHAPRQLAGRARAQINKVIPTSSLSSPSYESTLTIDLVRAYGRTAI